MDYRIKKQNLFGTSIRFCIFAAEEIVERFDRLQPLKKMLKIVFTTALFYR